MSSLEADISPGLFILRGEIVNKKNPLFRGVLCLGG